MQVTVGTALVPFQAAMKPNVVLADAPRAPFQAMFEAITEEPLCESVALQACEIV